MFDNVDNHNLMMMMTMIIKMRKILQTFIFLKTSLQTEMRNLYLPLVPNGQKLTQQFLKHPSVKIEYT